jgi:23S rRNA pseudouridine955/2504/2580 synthase/23S rRNA pseudouridine1911/1915/1917 synthase
VKTALEIIFENDQFIVVNKPAGLLSIPDREGKEVSLKQLLQQRYDQVLTVHRLDRETSGIIVFARDADAHKYLSQQFEERSVEKYYVGIVNGVLPEKQKTIDAPITEHPAKRGTMMIHKKGKPAVTDYEVLEAFGRFSLLQFRIHTGRTHQIRVHMQYIGHPLVCDELYGDGLPVKLSSFKRNYKLSKNEEEEKPILARVGLHAQRLLFTDMNGNAYTLEAEMPKDMRALLQQLRKVNS